MDTYIGICPGHCTGDSKKIQQYLERLSRARDFLMGKQEEVLSELNNKMILSAQERRYEDALEYKNTIQQIESSGSKQIVRDAIDGDATVIVSLEKYGQIFMSAVEIKNSMIVGVHEYKLANPLSEAKNHIIEQGVLQFISSH